MELINQLVFKDGMAIINGRLEYGSYFGPIESIDCHGDKITVDANPCAVKKANGDIIINPYNIYPNGMCIGAAVKMEVTEIMWDDGGKMQILFKGDGNNLMLYARDNPEGEALRRDLVHKGKKGPDPALLEQ